jgi:PTH1 family peptidyl-tRNA hydrolase
MKLVVGLGNPGKEYHETRHNAGFMVLDRLARRHGLSGAKEKFHAGVLEGRIRNEQVLLMQPTTYMNRSGLAVGEATRFYRLPNESVMVVVDDIALPVGSIRLRASGSPGGHNGLADIQRALASGEYPRLRVGIGAPMIDGHKIPQREYVLGAFTAEQRKALDPALDLAAQAIECWVTDGLAAAMNRYNRSADGEGENDTKKTTANKND